MIVVIGLAVVAFIALVRIVRGIYRQDELMLLEEEYKVASEELMQRYEEYVNAWQGGESVKEYQERWEQAQWKVWDIEGEMRRRGRRV